MKCRTMHLRKFMGVGFVLLAGMLAAQPTQDTLSGSVTYLTSQNLYVRFTSTADLRIGDTLHQLLERRWLPVMVIEQMSSTSAVGKPLQPEPMAVGTRLYRRPAPMRAQAVPENEVLPPPVVEVPETIPGEVESTEGVPNRRTGSTSKAGIQGRISAAAYINTSDQPGSDRERMRYTLSMRTQHAGDRGFSSEIYTTFRHTVGEWTDVRHHFDRAFRLYSLAIQYDLSPRTHFWLGRKINLNLANLGAIDGLQAEHGMRDFFVGAFGGWRPDPYTYRYNSKLLQFGAYAGHRRTMGAGQITTTLAFAEQRNGGATDRRYLYVQHSNSVIRHIQLFASAEFDLYTIDEQFARQGPRFTSAYVSLRYRLSKWLTLFGSFDARRNVVYYETYKSFLDQFIDDQTRQGLRFSLTLRPAKRITLGASLGSRFERGAKATRNLNSYLTFARTPVLGLSASLSGVWIQTSYLTGTILGMRVYRDLFKGKLYTEIQYRHAEYRYGGSEFTLAQHIVGLNTTWRLRKKLSLAVNFEGELQKQRTLYRIYGHVTQRF